MKGSQGFWNASPSAFLDWFWDCEGVEERWGEEWEKEESRDGQGKDWGELSFAFGVGSGEYEMMREEWSGEFDEWNERIEEISRKEDDEWDLISNSFSEWEELDEN